MNDFEEGEGLCPFEEGEEGVEELMEPGFGEEDWEEEECAEEDGGPEGEAEGVVGEEVLLFEVGGGLGFAAGLVVHDGLMGVVRVW